MTPARDRLPSRRFHASIDFEHAGLRYTAGVGYFDDGRAAEIFLNCAKSGAAAETNARDGAILLSLCLQHGVPLDLIRKTLTCDSRGEPSGPLGVVVDRLKRAEP